MKTYGSVAVTGMGVISAIGQDTGEFTAALRQGKSGIGYLDITSGYFPRGYIGAGITGFSLAAGLQRIKGLPGDILQRAEQCARRSPMTIQSAVLSALEAWQQARLHTKPPAPHRLGIVVAGSNLSCRYQYGMQQTSGENPEYLNPRYILHFFDTDHVGTLSEILGIRGEGFTVGGASASGNVAIIQARRLVNLGVVDACLVIGALTDLSPMELQGFVNLGALGGKSFYHEPQKACRPFDRDHEGFIYGQAGGCLVLEAPDSVEKRGVEVLAEIAGGAVVLDGNRLADPDEEGEARAMSTALAGAGLEPGDIDYINTHGTSTPLGDETELKAVKKVFKENFSNIWLNSTKGMTGHCLHAAGVIEAIAAVVQMREGFVHANLNLDHPIDSEGRFSGAGGEAAQTRTAMSNSFGFGGINTSIILKRGV